jgi:ABC transport system ATP-binding/permease protein
VSHDRYFLNRVCTSILAFEGEGRVAYSVGNYDYYLEKRDAAGPARNSTGDQKSDASLSRRSLGVGGSGRRFAVANSDPATAGVAAPPRRGKEKPRKLKYKEEREWESMEANILSAENEVSDLEATFAAADFYAKPRAEIFDLETQLKTARDKVAHLYARWHELELLQSVPSP